MTVNVLKRLAASLVAVAVLAIMAAPAQAEFKIYIKDVPSGAGIIVQDNIAAGLGPAAPIVAPYVPNGTDFNPAVGGIFFSNAGLFPDFSGGSNMTATAVQPGMSGPQGLLASTVLAVKNTGTVARTLEIAVTYALPGTAYSYPSNPPAFEVSSSGTWNVTNNGPGGNVVSIQSFATFNNPGEFDGTILPLPANVYATTPIQTAALPSAGVGVFMPMETTVQVPGPSTFIGLTHVYKFTIGGGATYQLTLDTEVVPVPEPATFLSALPLLAGGLYWARRRRA